jgi:hypothetical protein
MKRLLALILIAAIWFNFVLPASADVASITRAQFPKNRADDVIAQFRNEVVPTFNQLKQQGDVKQAFFVIDRDGGEAIGIAIYDNEAKLKAVEGKRSSEAPNDVKDPNRAPTAFAKKRAKDVRDSGANMEKSEWYEVIGEVR